MYIESFNGSIAISLFATRIKAWISRISRKFQWLNRHKPLCNEIEIRSDLAALLSFNGSIAISLFATILLRFCDLCCECISFNGSIAISLFATPIPTVWSSALLRFQWLNRHKPLCNGVVPFLIAYKSLVSMAQSP